MNPSSPSLPETSPATPEADPASPLGVSFPITVTIPSDVYHTYELLKRLYRLSDSQLASQALLFAIFCQQTGTLKNKADFMDSMIHQFGSLSIMVGRLQQAVHNQEQAIALASAAHTGVLNAIEALDPKAKQPGSKAA